MSTVVSFFRAIQNRSQKVNVLCTYLSFESSCDIWCSFWIILAASCICEITKEIHTVQRFKQRSKLFILLNI